MVLSQKKKPCTSKQVLSSEFREGRSLGHELYAPRLQTEKTFFILNLEIVQLCSSSILPHEISMQNCAGFEAKQKSKSSWTHSNPGTWKRFLILKIAEMENRLASPGPRLGEGLN